jgi:hypothetical protein
MSPTINMTQPGKKNVEIREKDSLNESYRDLGTIRLSEANQKNPVLIFSIPPETMGIGVSLKINDVTANSPII